MLNPRGDLTGVIEVLNKKGGRAFDAVDEYILTSLASFAAVAIENSKLFEKLNENIVLQKKVQSYFEKYVSPEILERIQKDDRDITLPERYELTVMFVDLRGFTPVSESITPEGVRAMLNEYAESVINIALRYKGTIDKFIGDGIMILFGAPVYQSDHADMAVLASLEMLYAHRNIMEGWRKTAKPELNIGIGISSGQVVVGEVGSDIRSNYTVIGHNVNVGSRLCSVADPGEALFNWPISTLTSTIRNGSGSIRRRSGFWGNTRSSRRWGRDRWGLSTRHSIRS